MKKNKRTTFKRTVGANLCVARGISVRLKRRETMTPEEISERSALLSMISQKIRETMADLPEYEADLKVENSALFEAARRREQQFAMGLVATFAAFFIVLVVFHQKNQTASMLQARAQQALDHYSQVFGAASMRRFHDQVADIATHKLVAEKHLENFAKSAKGFLASKTPSSRKLSSKAERAETTAKIQNNEPPINLGYQLMIRGRQSDAIPYFAEEIRREPNNALARRYLAHCLHETGQHSLAATQFAYLAAAGPLCKYDLSAYAKSLHQAGHLGRAASVYSELLKQDANDFSSRVRLARIYLAMGAKDKCHSLCAEGVQIASSGDQVRQLRELASSVQFDASTGAAAQSAQIMTDVDATEAIPTKAVNSGA